MKNFSKSISEVVIYTDGACAGNPGPGGYGAVMRYNNHRKEISRGFRKTTNNRMELMAVIVSLQLLKNPCKVKLYTDSQYIADSVNRGWAKRWQENNWKRSKKEKAMNPDLWEKLLELLNIHEVDMQWLKGHDGDPENERADYLATQAIKSKTLKIDQVYENSQS
jgi:ribonuclease HI